EAHFIIQRVSAVARLTKQRQSDVLGVLLILRGASDNCPTLSLRSVTASLNTIETQRVLDILQHLETSHLVRRRLNPDTDSEHWSLYHEYLARGIAEADRLVDKWSVIIREQARAHTECGGRPLLWWQTLLSPLQQVVVLVQRVRGRITIGHHRRYLLHST